MHRHELKEAYDYENKSQLNGDGAKIIGNNKMFRYLQAVLRTYKHTNVQLDIHMYIHTNVCMGTYVLSEAGGAAFLVATAATPQTHINIYTYMHIS